MKKLLKLALFTTLLTLALSVTALAAEVEVSVGSGANDTITFDTSTGAITSANDAIVGADIPSTINGVAVTSIGEEAFYSCKSLSSITIPSSVTAIGASAFYNCQSLTSVTIPSSVTSIETFTFFCCTSLTDITIPSSVTAIGDSAFAVCKSLDNVTIPSSVTSIEHSVFQQCTSLTSIVLPSSVTSIGDSAFLACASLTSIDIPSSVISIGDSAFWRCTGLTSITIPSSVTSIGLYAFRDCTSLTSFQVDAANTAYCSQSGVLFNKSMTELLGYPIGRVDTAYIVPSSVETVGTMSFYACTNLTGITIPSSVTAIRAQAFGDCDDLTIYGYDDSFVQLYAQALDIPFVDLGATKTATLSGTKLTVNGVSVSTQAYMIEDNNYIKLRDLATMITGTEKNFEVTWNDALGTIELQSGLAYTSVGGELATGGEATVTATLNASPTYLDGVLIDLTAYTIDDNNYFKLRDVMALFDVGVGYDDATQTASLDTSASYE